jgi:hypothetical protein
MQATRIVSWTLRLTAVTGSGFSMNSRVSRSRPVETSVPNMVGLWLTEMIAAAADKVQRLGRAESSLGRLSMRPAEVLNDTCMSNVYIYRYALGYFWSSSQVAVCWIYSPYGVFCTPFRSESAPDDMASNAWLIASNNGQSLTMCEIQSCHHCGL